MHDLDSIVLIVNPDPGWRTAILATLTAAGLNAVAFATAAECLVYPRTDVPTCHVVEVGPNDMTGFALQAVVLESAEVVFVSPQADAMCAARAFKRGAADFLTLPFSDDELVRAIRGALDQATVKRAQRIRSAKVRERWNCLSAREREVLQLIVSGYLNKQAAAELGISEITVKAHRGRMMCKMLASSLPDLVRMAALLDVPVVACRRTVAGAVRETPGVAAVSSEWFRDNSRDRAGARSDGPGGSARDAAFC